jgi:hypothetical protein
MNRRRSFLWAPLALAAAACGLLAPAQVQAQASTTKLPLSVPFPSLVVPCANGGAGELVLFSGSLEGFILTTIDANGGVHTDTRLNATGVSGVGAVTGAKYQGVGASQHHFNFRGSAPFEVTFESTFGAIGQGPGNNLRLQTTIHLTFDANGVLEASVSSVSATCG